MMLKEFQERELERSILHGENHLIEILNLKYKGKEVCFLPRHARGHFISPSNINFRANIDALKTIGSN